MFLNCSAKVQTFFEIASFIVRKMVIGDRLAVEEERSLIPKSGVRLQRQGTVAIRDTGYKGKTTTLIQRTDCVMSPRLTAFVKYLP